MTIRKDAAEATKNKIIQCAYQIVGDAGFESLTTARLVKEAGIAKGTLYHHFASLDQVIHTMLCQQTENFMVAVPVEQFKDLRSYLYAVGDYLLDVIASNRQIMNVFLGILPKGYNDQELNQICIKLMDATCGKIFSQINTITAQPIPEVEIDKAVRMVDMFSIGCCVHQGMFNDKLLYRQIWRDFADMLVARFDLL